MSSITWSTSGLQNNDAEFRALYTELEDKLQFAGLVKVTATGQINLATVTRPTTVNTSAGFSIFRFNDSMQVTAPIFLKFEYGTLGTLGRPKIDVAIGTTHDGAGTLGGVLLSSTTIAVDADTVAGNFPSYLTVADGFLGLGWKLGVYPFGGATGILFLYRSTNSSALPNANGVQMYTSNSIGSNDLRVRYADFAGNGVNSLGFAQNTFSLNPHNIGTAPGSAVGGDLQVLLHWYRDPRIRPTPYLCTCWLAEIPQGTTFSTTLAGTIPRTYISLGRFAGTGGAFTSVAVHGNCMQWEI